MRILFISFVPPGEYNGGQRAVEQSLLTLSELGSVDYIGPDFEYQYNIHQKYIITATRYYEYIRVLLSLHTSKYRMSFIKIISQLDSNYDIVWLDNSKVDISLKDFKNLHYKNIVVRMHNHEALYFKELLNHKRNLKSFIYYLLIKYRERKNLSIANSVVCLTNIDSINVMKFYQLNKKPHVIPIFFKDPGVKKDWSLNKTIIFFGALNFDLNVQGIFWFLSEVWPKLSGIKLIIAGRSPVSKLINYCSNIKDVSIIPDIQNPIDIYKLSPIVIAPIQKGSGQKVKVVEALSFGRIVLCTEHASAGYEKISPDVVRAQDNAETWVSDIKFLFSLPKDEIDVLCNKSYGEFKKHFSMSNAKREYKNYIYNLTQYNNETLE